MDTAQWPQEMVVKSIEDIAVTKPTITVAASLERKPRPQKEQALNCPRCHSTNTKFCYYNNYSLTQPRYFCKTCRRYWTEGGSLRNIPVGGGSRKNKRSNSNSASCSSVPPNKKLPSDLITAPQNPKIDEGQDLNLAFRNIPELGIKQNNNNNNSVSASASSTITTNTTSTTTAAASSTSHHHHHHHLSALELLTGITNSGSRGFNSFMHNVPLPVPADPNSSVYTCGYPLQDFKPTLNFSLDHGIGSLHGNNVQETSGRLLFPFEDLKHVSSTNTTTIMDNHNNNKEQHHGDSTGGFWTGMLGGGGGGGTW